MTEASVELQGVVLHVDDLARALDFYTELLDFAVAHRTSEAAILANASGTATIALRERRAGHYTDRTVQALVWRVPTPARLGQVQQRLQQLNTRTLERTVAADGLTLLTARDPDGQRLLFVHYEGVAKVPGNIPAEVYWY